MTTYFKLAMSGAFILVLAAAAGAIAQESRIPRSSGIVYTVSMSHPATHLLEVEARIQPGSRGTGNIDLVMPVWTPGSYLIREFERHVQNFAASDQSGHPLNWHKTNKNTWRVDAAGAVRELIVTYKVYANELTVRTSELNDQHAFWNNAALLMFISGDLKASSTLRIEPPPGWSVATGLPAVPGRENTFNAQTFDVLYDSPVEVGTFKTISFEVRGVPHRIVIDGIGNYDPARIQRDVQKIVEYESSLMGEIPYHDYTFILHLRTNGGGGLEHLNSTALEFRRFNFKPESSYRGFLYLVAHEFFHLWNVKRIRPDALGPFDYSAENYTRLLWVAEGITDYYADLAVHRAGFVSDTEYLANLARNIQELQNTPGRLEMSAEDASFDAWIKYYRQDENAINSQISYYSKGAILGMLLDLNIRRSSHGKKSLDDVMRYLYSEYFKKGRNYSPEDFQRACELQAGTSLRDFFTRYVHGTQELNYDDAFQPVGLRLETTAARGASEGMTEVPYLGVLFDQQGDRLIIRTVYSGTPAYEQGLNTGDQIVAVDGVRATRETFNSLLGDKKPGEIVHLTLFRSDDLRTFDLKVGGRIPPNYSIVPVAQPSEEQQRLLQGWLSSAR